ncbi:MAG: MBL fold metallo-hydrolase [Bacteroidales bacterium]|nr:MBL fold metallo-hydrolase [Bacteroidales bacterium]
MKITPIEADFWKMDGGVAFGVVPKSLWTRVYPEDVDNLIRITTRCLLIQDGDRNILIDTGMGDKRGEKYYSYKYRSGESGLTKPLEKAGLSPASITDILFTHLHDDHVGGATRNGASGEIEEIFPNAKYWCSEAQWEWSKNSNKRESAAFFTDNLQPLEKSGRLNLITNEGNWLPGIELRIFNGHTRGQIIPLISACGTRFVFAADFIPAMAYIPVPWVPSVDIEPLLTLAEKESFLNEAIQNNYVLIFEHDYLHEACHLANSEKGIVAGEEVKINQICN